MSAMCNSVFFLAAGAAAASVTSDLQGKDWTYTIDLQQDAKQVGWCKTSNALTYKQLKDLSKIESSMASLQLPLLTAESLPQMSVKRARRFAHKKGLMFAQDVDLIVDVQKWLRNMTGAQMKQLAALLGRKAGHCAAKWTQEEVNPPKIQVPETRKPAESMTDRACNFLFGTKDKTAKKAKTAKKEKKHAQPRSEAGLRRDEMAKKYGLEQSLADTRDKLALRGEKLDDLVEKTEKLKEGADKFYDACTQLRQQEDRKAAIRTGRFW